MPQLMPLLWMFSFFMVLFLLIVGVALYSSCGQCKWMMEGGVDIKSKNWMW